MRTVNLAFALATVVVFGCLLLFDTTALLRLAGMCLAGDCGVPTSWIAAGGAAIVVAVAARAMWRRRRGGTRRPVRRPAAPGKPGKKSTKVKPPASRPRRRRSP